MCEPVSNNQNKNGEICGQGIKRCPRCGRIIPDSYVPYYPYIPNPWYYQPTVTWPWIAYYNIPTWTCGTTQ